MTQNIPKKIEGIPVGFDIIKMGKALVKLNDGFYVEITNIPLKILKQPQTDPEGNPVYSVMSNTAMAVWTKDQIQKLKES